MTMIFHSTKPYLIRIYVDGVNTITGQNVPGHEEQDYIVVPDQTFLQHHKIASGPQTQFVCPAFGTNGSTHCNIQFEVTPLDMSTMHPITVRSMTGAPQHLFVQPQTDCYDTRAMLKSRQNGIRISVTRLIMWNHRALGGVFAQLA
jgi:hypothetical protein